MSVETRVTAADTHAAEPDEPGSSDRAVLVVYEGDGQDATTRVVDVPDGAQLTVGRSRTAAIHVESERVSRIHARIARRGRELVVEDTGSRNKTWVNGVAIADTQRLVSGDEIVIGPATIVVSVTSRVAARPDVESSRYLTYRLAAEIDRGQRYRRTFALIMVRLDGHVAEADAAIDRIAGLLRPMDVLAEYSSSELAIVLPELDAAAASEVARAIATAARTRDGGIVPALKVAVGVATFPGHGTTEGALISRARAAVESVRRSGRDEVGSPPEEPAVVEGIVGDPQMRRVYDLVRKVADHPITVLVRGETGVGKEVVAAAIHRASKRRSGPLIRLNCASLPETLLESELFGHERGAFTGADRRRQGFFEAAAGGTLFLDEIGELSAATQAKLLRVLEERRLTRVGGTEEIEVDVRVVCATHRDLEVESTRGGFRADLFFRISAFTILVPPLRDRPDEIIPLAEHFLRQTAADGRRPAPTLSADAAAVLRRYPWPGNVRELRNAIERACVVHSGGVLEAHDLPERVRDGRAASAAAVALAGGADVPHVARDVRDRMAELEHDAILAALEACGGNQTEAAKKLGMSRRALIYRMEKHGLKPLPPAARRE
jgi:DNA-binding NtrC family response regulator